MAKYELRQTEDTWELRSGPAIDGDFTYPIGAFNFVTAKTSCSKLGDGFQLISNMQWQTVAIQIEKHDKNWEDNNIGVTRINIGHVDASATSHSYPSSDDNNSCFETGAVCNLKSWHLNRRTHFVNETDEVIWDFSGNAAEFVLDVEKFSLGTATEISQMTTATHGNTNSLGETTRYLVGPQGTYTHLNSGNYGGLGGLKAQVSGPEDTITLIRGGELGANFVTPGVFSTFTFGLASIYLGGTGHGAGVRCVYVPENID